jgi:hypothetical protein
METFFVRKTSLKQTYLFAIVRRLSNSCEEFVEVVQKLFRESVEVAFELEKITKHQPNINNDAVRCGAARCGAMRCGAVR